MNVKNDELKERFHFAYDEKKRLKTKINKYSSMVQGLDKKKYPSILLCFNEFGTQTKT